MTGGFRIEVLSRQHQREAFNCGVDTLDYYLHHQATQDIRRLVASCYVAIDIETNRIAGYYTLSAAGIPLQEMPDLLTKRLPLYSMVPAARLGRLALELAFRGQKLGAALLWDALLRTARSEIAVYALVADAKDDGAASFYQHHGFVAYGSQPRQLLIPMARINKK